MDHLHLHGRLVKSSKRAAAEREKDPLRRRHGSTHCPGGAGPSRSRDYNERRQQTRAIEHFCVVANSGPGQRMFGHELVSPCEIAGATPPGPARLALCGFGLGETCPFFPKQGPVVGSDTELQMAPSVPSARSIRTATARPPAPHS